MSKAIDWNLYETRKAEIQALNLSPDEYEKAIVALLDELEG